MPALMRHILPSAAAALAQKMGLPVQLVCAVNENDIVHRAISTGDFTLSENVAQTWSTAMDIQVIHHFKAWDLAKINQ